MRCPSPSFSLDHLSPSERRLFRVEEFAQGPSVRLGLDHLSPTERRLFDALYLSHPNLVPREVLLRVVCGDGYDMHALHVNVSRLRKKLRAHGWRIERGRRAYRMRAKPGTVLVEPT